MQVWYRLAADFLILAQPHILDTTGPIIGREERHCTCAEPCADSIRHAIHHGETIQGTVVAGPIGTGQQLIIAVEDTDSLPLTGATFGRL